jgi:serine/threonine-protein kinase
MATVHLGRMAGIAGFEKLVAVKTIHHHLAVERRFVEMFLDEAQIASQINHPNVCTVFDFGETDGTYYMAMEYLVGESLHEAMEAILALDDEATYRTFPLYAARILAEASEGLHAAHELSGPRGQSLGVVHRDVSPQNLMVTYEGAVKVTDFGCAKAIHRVSQTATGTLKGKVGYAAPEAMKMGAVDRRADVWGLGVVLWESLTLDRLFRRETDVQTALAVLQDPIPYAAEGRSWVPAPLADIAARALSRDPDARYATAREMGKDLRRFLIRSGYSVESAELGDFMRQIFPGGVEHHRRLMDQARISYVPEEEAPTEERLAAIDVKADTDPPPRPSTGSVPLRLRMDEDGDYRPPGRSPWPVVLSVVALAALAGAGWYAVREGLVSLPGASDPSAEADAHDATEPPRTGSASGAPIVPDDDEPGASGAATTGGDVSAGSGAADEGAPEAAVDDAVHMVSPSVPTETRAARAREDDPSASDRARETAAPVTTVIMPRGSGTTATTAEPTTMQGTSGPPAAPEETEPAEAPAVPTTGTVRILADGGWSIVQHEGRELGRTPLSVELPDGMQTLRLLPYGRPPGDVHTIRVYAGTSVTLRISIREDDGTP